MAAKGHKPDFSNEIIEEGKTRVIVPKLKDFAKQPSDYAPSKAPVFYNPVMELNRDIAVLAVQAFQKSVDRKITVCEPLTGTGLRGIRYALEVEGIKRIVLGDINKNAFELAKLNVQTNDLSRRVGVNEKEANLLLINHNVPRKRFDVIDIDPFGSPAPFLDSAVRALRNQGLLSFTATDMASLCGVHPRTCLRRYGGRPLRTEYCHELAIRLLCGSLAEVAAKYDIGVKVVFSHRGEHYVRVYATISYGAKNADDSLENMGFVLHCFKCDHREISRKYPVLEVSRECSECGSRLSVAGPLWAGKIADAEFCDLILKELEQCKLRLANRITRMLTLIKEELDSPISYYDIDQMCDALGLPVPSIKKVILSLKDDGFSAVPTHFSSRGIRSDVPAKRLAKILLCLGQTTNC